MVACPRARDAAAARALFARALTFDAAPVEVTTDLAPGYLRLVDEYAPAERHLTKPHANTVVEADHGGPKARLRRLRGLKTLASARTVAAGHAFVQNLRRGH
jgi:IS6 family transposase